MTTLNAGCGGDPWGDVRIDVDPQAPASNRTMDVQAILFPDRFFSETRCISVLEHVKDWRTAIRELCRVTDKTLVIEVPVNSDLRYTDPFRLLWPTLKNLRLVWNLRTRARETLWQFRPDVLATILFKQGFMVVVQKIFQIYHGFPSRCWRISGVRTKDFIKPHTRKKKEGKRKVVPIRGYWRSKERGPK